MYMCMKFPPRDLNIDSCPPTSYISHPTNTYTCGVTIVPKVCDSLYNFYNLT